MTYKHRYYLFATPSAASWVRGMFQTLAGERPHIHAMPDKQTGACRSPLNGKAQSPTAAATHFACSFPCTDGDVEYLDGVERSGGLPNGLRYVRVDVASGLVVKTNVAQLQSRVGTAWSTSDALDRIGLKFRRNQ